MAIFNVIKYQGSDKEFAWRYPHDNLNIGSQLIVNISQTAFFVRGGVIYDQFAPGTYTLKTNNIPLLIFSTTLDFFMLPKIFIL